MATEHDIPRPQLVHEHVEEYIWQLMCLIQGCDLITRKPTPASVCSVECCLHLRKSARSRICTQQLLGELQ